MQLLLGCLVLASSKGIPTHTSVVEKPADQANTLWQLEHLKADIFGNLHCFVLLLVSD
jgi:hypothetical protein